MTKAHDITGVIEAGLARRYRTERRFKALGILALAFAGLMLLVLLATILRPGISGFTRHEVRVEMDMRDVWARAGTNPEAVDYYAFTNDALRATLDEQAMLEDKVMRRKFYELAGTFAAFDMHEALAEPLKQWGTKHPSASMPASGIVPVWITLSDNADQLLKGHIDRNLPEAQRPLNDRQIAWVDGWRREGRIRRTLNTDFFTRGDSRAPEAAGFMGAIVGSLLTLMICLGAAVPIALMAAVTLEEFARKTRAAELLEVVINNLAAVPSIIYGLLGLSIYLQWFELPRSSPLVGGLTLALLIMPVMIIAARASIRAVPPSMRQAATALGATPLQVVRHHVLPYALPGILTGTILSVCRALGETAPLLMVGMVAFVADIPRGPLDPATVMPVEVYLWASSPELGFIEKTSSAILVLLLILLLLNAAAIRLRNKSQLTWN
jgi:phosphate transport system permease protein